MCPDSFVMCKTIVAWPQIYFKRSVVVDGVAVSLVTLRYAALHKSRGA